MIRCRRNKVALILVIAAATTMAFSQNDQITGDLSHARPHYKMMAPRGKTQNASTPVTADATSNAAQPAVDTLVNFSGSYRTEGFDPNGKLRQSWFYTMIGNKPSKGGTTTINAPVVPVSVDLLDTDGSVRLVNGQPLHYDVTPFILPTLFSPVFQNSTYTSSDIPTQISDAVQRAEFFNAMAPDWHTLLNGSLKTPRTMQIPRGSYRFALLSNGECCEFILVDIDVFFNLLFPATAADTTTPIGAAENNGDITPKDLSSFLFPNTYLYEGGDPNNCCVLGFHTFDTEPGDAGNGGAQKNFVVDYASFISPGIFGGGFEDVTALSHEVAESYNDPFVASDNKHGITPWWLSPNGNCQDDLEVGDVIEGLPKDVFPIALNGLTYHPQNEALLEWFEFESPSTALHGAYSYPDETTLTALSPRQFPNCH